ncbi:class I SAM-dependent methyltransferase [Candidatus Nitronereus thalassa]|uniref:Class I SAM-dependent methyltransferase n=1 Tax=Candidatus Nitronereus thalassa TaxID=3020898 RepID=A0ABU3K638_9BACT|nr:class I SAM-dependent methyltransferase [Candidatus Nitronereus thalassa]MDT7041846.1 class I SAM-dependent methyltransferase [Candidatus Nitronereus thalassa]
MERAYQAPTGTRGLSVYVCCVCGLVQSLPRIDHVADRKVAVSGGADWGNIRYGKGFRTTVAISVLQEFVDLETIHSCLDVGSNRGSFVKHIKALAPQASILAIESDPNIVGDYSSIEGIDVLVNRIEDVTLPDNTFEVVYCGHTLEHLRSPRETLRQIEKAMIPGGLLFLEVPNLEFVGREDVVEEWFIDKHLFHFLPEHLTHYLEVSGFQVEAIVPDSSLENLTCVGRKPEEPAPRFGGEMPALATKSFDLIRCYQETMAQGKSRLRKVGDTLNELLHKQRVVVWGAGRLFDVLVQIGGLNTQALQGVIDKHLVKFTSSVHGCHLKVPDDLLALNPDVVLIMSRSYFSEIQEEVHTLIPSCEVIGVVQLLDAANAEQPVTIS